MLQAVVEITSFSTLVCAISIAAGVAGVGFDLGDSPPIEPPGARRCCAGDLGAVVDGIVVLATEVGGSAAVGVCADDSPERREYRPVFFLTGDPDCLIPSNLRIRARFLDFPSDIFRDFAVLGLAGRVDLDKECLLMEPRFCCLVVFGC